VISESTRRLTSLPFLTFMMVGTLWTRQGSPLNVFDGDFHVDRSPTYMIKAEGEPSDEKVFFTSSSTAIQSGHHKRPFTMDE